MDVSSIGLLDGRRGELRTMLLDDFLNIREGLNYFEQLPVTRWKL